MKYLLLITAFLVSAKTFACTCASGGTFCDVVKSQEWQALDGHVVILGEVIHVNNAEVRIKVLETMEGQPPFLEEIRMGQYASLCELGIDLFKEGDKLVLAVYPDEVQTYHFLPCTYSYIYLFENRLEGYIAPGITSILRSALDELSECSSVFTELDADINWNVYPTLTRGRVLITPNSSFRVELVKYRIFNSIGELLQKGTAAGESTNSLLLDIGSFPNGVYFIELVAISGKRQIFKIVKQS